MFIGGSSKGEILLPNSPSTTSFNKQIEVEVIGSDLQGKQFFVRSRTSAVHDNGVSVPLAKKLAMGAKVIVRNSDTDEEFTAVVAEVSPGAKSGDVYRLAYQEAVHEVVRTLDLTPAPSAPASVVRLECSFCHSVSPIPLSEMDLEIFASTHELIRYCETCFASTEWREFREDRAATRSKQSPTSTAAGDEASAAGRERRQNRRTAMRAMACVRFSGTEIVVECEDISKGGFRFKSSREYPAGTRVEVAVPYTKSSTNIFCPATISYCQKLPEGKFRQGVNYIKRGDSSNWNS